MKQHINPETKYKGIIQIPPSKSDSQRAILAAALAQETSILKNVGICNDELAMLSAIQTLGAVVCRKEDYYEITGIENIPPHIEVNISESGLATRLLSGVFACSDGTQTISGSGSVLSRKMAFYFKHQKMLQCDVESHENYALPLTFKNKIEESNLTVNGGESSQDISGLLYGLIFRGKPFNLHVLHLKSRPYLQMTLNTLAHFNVTVEQQDFEYFTFSAEQKLQACTYTIEGDWSSASFWLVASALGKDIAVDGLNLSSLQADKQLLNILREANCSEVRSQFLIIDGDERTVIETDLTHCPDLFPALTTYCALTQGTSKLHGVHRLHNKESDRAQALIEEFTKLGVKIYTHSDCLIIEGKETLNGGSVNAHNDHRIAMCLAIAGMFANTPLTIENADCVEKSYPKFWEDLKKISLS